MLRTVRKKKRYANAFVDNKKRDGPAPSYLAIGDVEPINLFIGERVPKLSVISNSTCTCSPFASVLSFVG